MSDRPFTFYMTDRRGGFEEAKQRKGRVFEPERTWMVPYEGSRSPDALWRTFGPGTHLVTDTGAAPPSEA